MANRLLAPESLDSASWSKVNAVVDANATTAPDGTVTADRIRDSGLGGINAVRLQQAVSGLVNGNDYFLAWFIKADQTSWALMSDGGYTASFFKYVDIANILGGSVGLDVNNSAVEDYGNGWVRAWVTWTSGVDGAGVIRPSLAEADGDSTLTLDGTNSIFAWGIVLDDGTSPPAYVSQAGHTVVPAAGGSSARRTNLIHQLRHH